MNGDKTSSSPSSSTPPSSSVDAAVPTETLAAATTTPQRSTPSTKQTLSSWGSWTKSLASKAEAKLKTTLGTGSTSDESVKGSSSSSSTTTTTSSTTATKTPANLTSSQSSREESTSKPSSFFSKASKWAAKTVEVINAPFVEDPEAKEEVLIAPPRLDDSRMPWCGIGETPKETATLRNDILALSRSQDTFLIDPPENDPFPFELSAAQDQAQALLSVDPCLARAQGSRVFASLGEERFWRNYFYNISKLKVAALQGALVEDSSTTPIQASSSSSSSSGQAGDPVSIKPAESSSSREFISEPVESKSSTIDTEKAKAAVKEAGQKLSGFMSGFAAKAKTAIATATAKPADPSSPSSPSSQPSQEGEKTTAATRSAELDDESMPWFGMGSTPEATAELRDQILAMSTKKETFMEDPPEASAFKFDLPTSLEMALALLSVDPNLAKAQSSRMYAVLGEHRFWRNYFYRMSLVKQAFVFTELNRAASQTSVQQQGSGLDQLSASDSTSIPDLSRSSTLSSLPAAMEAHALFAGTSTTGSGSLLDQSNGFDVEFASDDHVLNTGIGTADAGADAEADLPVSGWEAEMKKELDSLGDLGSALEESVTSIDAGDLDDALESSLQDELERSLRQELGLEDAEDPDATDAADYLDGASGGEDHVVSGGEQPSSTSADGEKLTNVDS